MAIFLGAIIYFGIVTVFMTSETLSFCFDNLVEITIPQGVVRGSCSWIKDYRSFLGIPYASVTQRFQEPGEPPTWQGTFKANRGSVQCMQYSSLLRIPVGQEDCLVLNIFTPMHKHSKPYPVIAFLHGGGFYWGSNTDFLYNPSFLTRKNVTVVTINYRLGAFGFLCINKEAPGNIGLRDQLAALKWIQRNIAYFGGDPNSVTLYGESAGAASINYLLLSQSAEGLFHKAIISSGAISMRQSFSNNPIEAAAKVASRVGHNTTDVGKLLEVFRNASAEDIVKASHYDSSNNAYAPYIFKPCIEREVPNTRPLITGNPRDLLKKVGLNISVIMGYNDKEGIMWAANYDSNGLKKLDTDFDDIIPDYLHFNDDEEKQNFTENLKKKYFGTSAVNVDGLIDYFTDSVIGFPMLLTANNLLEIPDRVVYNYYFSYDSIRNLNKLISRLRYVPGANHADELFYLFDPVFYQVFPTAAKDMQMIDLLTDLWTNFAKTGEPTNNRMTWTRSEKPLKFLQLDTEVRTIELPHSARMEFWRQAYDRYQRNT